MSKGTRFPKLFWDSALRDELRRLGVDHFWVYMHLVHGPSNHVSGLLRVSIGAIAEDTGVDPDIVRKAIDDFADIGWCEYEAPYLWVRGLGNINDQLGTSDFRCNTSWTTSTRRYLDGLPDLPIVDRYRRHHGLVEVPQ